MSEGYADGYYHEDEEYLLYSPKESREKSLSVVTPTQVKSIGKMFNVLAVSVSGQANREPFLVGMQGAAINSNLQKVTKSEKFREVKAMLKAAIQKEIEGMDLDDRYKQDQLKKLEEAYNVVEEFYE